MIRASNDTTAPFVFAGVSNGQLEVIEGGGTTTTLLTSSPVTEPIWVRLVREEDSVEVYQSDDGVNFSLVTTVALTMANPFNMGMAIGATGQVGQVQVSDVVLAQAQIPDDGELVLEEVVGPGEGGMFEAFHDDLVDTYIYYGLVGAFFPDGVLSQPTPVRLTISNTNTTTYPDIEGFDAIYPRDQVRYIGPLATVEVPIGNVDLTIPSDQALFTMSSSIYEGELQQVSTRDVRFEVRIQLLDGSFAFYTRRFGPIGSVAFTSDFIKANLGEGASLPETLVISVQAVDISGAFPNPDDFLPPADRSNDGSIVPQSTTEPVYPIFQEGLYKIESDASKLASDFFKNCN